MLVVGNAASAVAVTSNEGAVITIEGGTVEYVTQGQ